MNKCFLQCLNLLTYIHTFTYTIILVSYTNDTTGRSWAGVTGLQRLFSVTLTQVILTSMDDDTSADDGIDTEQLDQLVLERALGYTIGVGLQVTHVTNVSDFVGWRTVGLLERVEVGAGRDTAVSGVPELVDVEPAKSIGAVTRNFVGDSGWLRFGGLLELDDTGDTGITL